MLHYAALAAAGGGGRTWELRPTIRALLKFLLEFLLEALLEAFLEALLEAPLPGLSEWALSGQSGVAPSLGVETWGPTGRSTDGASRSWPRRRQARCGCLLGATVRNCPHALFVTNHTRAHAHPHLNVSPVWFELSPPPVRVVESLHCACWEAGVRAAIGCGVLGPFELC